MTIFLIDPKSARIVETIDKPGLSLRVADGYFQIVWWDRYEKPHIRTVGLNEYQVICQ